MRLTSYTIHFKGGPITVMALDYEAAKILAQAEAIKRGWDYTIIEGYEEVETFTIEVPSWCEIGVFIKWYAPIITGLNDWVTEKIVGYGYNGFFHQAHNCPLYYTEFSEYEKTVTLMEETK